MPASPLLLPLLLEELDAELLLLLASPSISLRSTFVMSSHPVVKGMTTMATKMPLAQRDCFIRMHLHYTMTRWRVSTQFLRQVR